MVTCLYLLQPPAGPLLHIPRPQRRPDVSPRRRLPGAARRRGPRGCGGPGTAVISSDGLFVCIWISIYLHIYIRWRFTRGSILTRGELWLSSTRTTLTMCLIISSRVLSSQVCSHVSTQKVTRSNWRVSPALTRYQLVPAHQLLLSVRRSKNWPSLAGR